MERILTEVYISNGDKIKKYTCIWDTGSIETLISDQVVTDLNPDKHGYVYLKTIHKEQKSDKYLINLLLENHSKSMRLNCACFGQNDLFDVIIGMDIISYGVFLIENQIFTFEINSLL
jgi:hypothetical protein